MNDPVRHVIRPSEACARMGLSLSSFWRKAKNDPAFPKPFKLGAGTRGTVIDQDEFEAWLTACKNGQINRD